MENITGNTVHFYLKYMVGTIWFSNQMFNAEIHQKLVNKIVKLNCSAALKCFVTHWNVDRSIVDIPRTNICAERGVKLTEELY